MSLFQPLVQKPKTLLPEQARVYDEIQARALAEVREAIKGVEYLRSSFKVVFWASVALLVVGLSTGLATVVIAIAVVLFNKGSQDATILSVVLGVLTAASFLGVYVLRPLDSLERNAILAPLVGAIISVFWLQASSDKTKDKELKKLLDNFVLHMGTVLDKHTAAISKYVEALKSESGEGESEEEPGEGEEEENGAETEDPAKKKGKTGGKKKKKGASKSGRKVRHSSRTG
jgi:hypothetical protein